MAGREKNRSFEFAFELAKIGMKEKLPDLNVKYGAYLEEQGQFNEAADCFIKANRPREAVLMWV